MREICDGGVISIPPALHDAGGKSEHVRNRQSPQLLLDSADLESG